jgi:hypothetical protein
MFSSFFDILNDHGFDRVEAVCTVGYDPNIEQATRPRQRLARKRADAADVELIPPPDSLDEHTRRVAVAARVARAAVIGEVAAQFALCRTIVSSGPRLGGTGAHVLRQKLQALSMRRIFGKRSSRSSASTSVISSSPSLGLPPASLRARTAGTVGTVGASGSGPGVGRTSDSIGDGRFDGADDDGGTVLALFCTSGITIRGGGGGGGHEPWRASRNMGEM